MSLRYILLDLHLFGDGTEEDKRRSRKGLLWFLEALARWNQHYLRSHPDAPKLYQSGVKYKLPEQFENADVPEIGTIRTALDKAGVTDRNVRRALDHLNERCGGGEHFRDIPSVLENGGGDCFPQDARVLRRGSNGEAVPTAVGDLKEGDRVWGRGRWSLVKNVVEKGQLTLDRISLGAGVEVFLTGDHKVFVVLGDGSVRRIAVAQLEPGLALIRPVLRSDSCLPLDCPTSMLELDWLALDPVSESRVRVVDVVRGAIQVPCVDLTTDDHYVYLADAGVVVSQCDNLAAYRVAELREAGIRARPYITWRKRMDGGVTYHALVLWPDGSSEDPSLLLGMGGAEKAKERAEEVRKNNERQENLGKKVVAALAAQAAPSDDDDVDWGDA